MEFGEASPGPDTGLGGYCLPPVAPAPPEGFTDQGSCEASVEDALPQASLNYSDLCLGPDVAGQVVGMSLGSDTPSTILSTSEDGQAPERRLEGDASHGTWSTGAGNLGTHIEEEEIKEEELVKEEEIGEEVVRNNDWMHWEPENDPLAIGENLQDALIKSEESEQSCQRDSDDRRHKKSDHCPGEIIDEIDLSGNSSDEGTECENYEEPVDSLDSQTFNTSHNGAASYSPNGAASPKAQAVLCFDEYGNLTTSYKKHESESQKGVDNEAAQNLHETVKYTPKTEKSKKTKKVHHSPKPLEPLDSPQCNGEIKTPKSKVKSPQEGLISPALSDQELQQAFKEDFMSAEMSRYGRARKKKTEDGFFFGTLNFNELRKITSNSPRKSKGSNSKNSSPEQKCKVVSSEDTIGKMRLDESLDEMFQSGQEIAEEVGVANDSKDPDPVQMADTKEEEELVQSISKDTQDEEETIADGFTDDVTLELSQGEVAIEESKQVVHKKDDIDLPNHHIQGDGCLSSVATIASNQTSGPLTDTLHTKPKSRMDDAARLERRKRLSLRRRSEIQAAAELVITEPSERLLRRHSDVARLKRATQAFEAELKKTKRRTTQEVSDSTSCTDSQDSQDELGGLAVESVKSPTPSATVTTKETDIQSSEENTSATESSSTTKSGRTIRKPQLMDVSDEEKRQRQSRDQLRQNEALLNTSLECELAAAGMDMRMLEQEHPCEYLVGDLVWVHIRGSPLWPAMISYHPRLGQYTRISVSQNWYKFRSTRLYHVQFFSDNAQTYWIAPANVLPFKGYQKLTEHLLELKSKTKGIKKSKRLHLESLLKTLVHINKVTTGHKHERWMKAIDEGDAAMALDRYERIRKYALEYPEISSLDNISLKNVIPRRHSVPSYQKRKSLKVKVEKRKRGRPRKHPPPEEKPPSKKAKVNGESTDGEFSGFDENSSFEDKKMKYNAVSQLSKECSEQSDYGEQQVAPKGKQWKNSSKGKRTNYTALENGESLKRKYEPCYDDVSDHELSEVNSSGSSKRKRLEDDNGRGVYKVVRNEKACYRCEGVSTRGGVDMLRCKGPCCGVFHLECLGLTSHPRRDFKCEECLTGQHKCFLCKILGDVQRCSVPFCGKFYHEECVKKWPHVAKQRQQERFVCPRHICHMCAANADDMEDSVARTPPYTRCLRCPTTYHIGENCLAAGTEEISQQHHICTRHTVLPKNTVHHVNVNWCFCCSKGGSLLLCDQCPAAFHADCIKVTAPEGGYVCEDCENGKLPVYGDVVWVKVGIYRWWPGQVLHPRFIPDNIENLPHQQGMFCVHFFGSNDYYWVTKGRTFHYQEGDKGSRAASSKTLEQQFQRALEEAVEAYRAQRDRKALQETHRSEKGNLKPPPYIRVDANRPVGNVRLSKLDLAAVNRCDCDPSAENPCGSDTKCLNRMLMFECMREVCRAGDNCCNQRFQKRQYPNLCYHKTETRGWGLKTLDQISKGQFVIEYVGELIDDEEFRRRIDKMHVTKDENYYFLTIDKDIMIDAGPKGNLARFMNHSCQPNCVTQKWTVGGDTRVGLFAIDDIPADSELTFNYNLQCVGTEKKRCSCGASNCSGFIGVKAQKNESQGTKKDKLGKRKKRRRRKEIKMSEDECFRCGIHGDLILCDVAQCPKGYHLQCLGLETLPKGKWICPWHHCDECGQRSARLNRCDFCPNSFCRQHLPGNLQIIDGIGNVCQDHNIEDLEALRGRMAIAEVTDKDNLSGVLPEEPEAMENGIADTREQVDVDPVNTNLDPRHNNSQVIPGRKRTNAQRDLSINGILALKPTEEGPDQSGKNLRVLSLKRKVGTTRPLRLSQAPDGPENSSAVMNVTEDIMDDKGSPVKPNENKGKALKSPVSRKGGRKAQASSVAKPVNES